MKDESVTDPERDHFLGMLKRFRTAMLITHTGSHGIHARPMAIADVEENGRVWFLTSAKSPKVNEIQLDSEVSRTAQDANDSFLTLSGRAVLLGDREKIRQLWREPFRVWFPDGLDDPDIQLIAVRPSRGEYWDNTGLSGAKYFWEAAKAYVTGTTPPVKDTDVHGAVDLQHTVSH